MMPRAVLVVRADVSGLVEGESCRCGCGFYFLEGGKGDGRR